MVLTAAFEGLHPADVADSRARFGSNALPPPATETFMDKLKDNFDDPLIRILCLALLVTMGLAVLGYADFVEGVGIAAAVFVATFVATYSEYRNEASFQALQAQASRITVSAFRAGAGLAVIPIDDVVVGDYVLLQAGDAAPADGVLVSGSLHVSQQSLTGEPGTMHKVAPLSDHALGNGALSLAHPSCVFRGSLVTEGEAVLHVRAVGVATVYGKAAADMGADSGRLAPLQVKLGHLADIIARLGYIGAAAIAVSFLFKQVIMDNGYSLAGAMAYLSTWSVALHDIVTSLILAIIVVVVAVPEGLPMMIAIVLSLNMRKLLARNVLVRRLIGIETAGCMDLLLVDKTGTLTHGTFVPCVLHAPDGEPYPSYAALPPHLARLTAFTILHSTSAVVSSSAGSPVPVIAGGNPTDRALLRFLPDSLLTQAARRDEGARVIDQFSAIQLAVSADDRALFRGVAGSSAGGGTPSRTSLSSESITLIKGASEVIVLSCTHCYTRAGDVVPFDAERRARLLDAVTAAAADGTRFLALAATSAAVKPHFYTSSPGSSDDNGTSDTPRYAVPSGCILVGVVGMTDTLRPEAPRAVALAQRAGIQVVMITGDRLETAAAVATKAGLLDANAMPEQPLKAHAFDPAYSTSPLLTSAQLAQLSDAELTERLPHLRVVARALPSDKSRLVRVAQASRRPRLVGHAEPVPQPRGLRAWLAALLFGQAPVRPSSRGIDALEAGLTSPGVLQSRSSSVRVVGMSGDGINDTAALKLADVSFAMGSGSEIAKEASDVVILDNNIQSILNATLYGRTIYTSILKFIVFQSTVNVASTVIVFLGPFCGFDFPLTLIQLLWVNMVMDTLAALAFGGEPALEAYMDDAPISRSAPIVTVDMAASFLVNGAFIALAAIAFLVWDPIVELFSRRPPSGAYSSAGGGDAATAKVETPSELDAKGGPVFLTAFFSFFIFVCTLNAFNVRVPHIRLLEALGDNRGFLVVIPLIFVVQVSFTLFFGSLLRVVPLTLDEWAWVFGLATLIIPFDMARKALRGQAGLKG
ncbi:uncharacterized protein AMSG_03982 [Thecamonas trahens ATCC 50062]|uniref:Cation-transporting P-type ATPase N-terminal domain-containing protein n=1 Tax=Thecamonas trahens ATCC 50062 TaxID=461836 RepID=A0A0L0D6C8_THETB|nr:hypothetical protein AMSG_03982 [Thecamonas trahens ATCC 50062]KNC47755.1 hypothetical protein AMSG_03982 [Thecamonas trahens ATCC 50062]|eukprot:XP_013759233.1 hypothetical protein AMSG_03982 [Thecamonas trahens ATCC 50062]